MPKASFQSLADPVFWLGYRMREMVALSTVVPGLVDESRQTEFDRIAASIPASEGDIALDMYEATTGMEGSADFARVVYGTSVVLAYELFAGFLVDEFVRWRTWSQLADEERKKLATDGIKELKAVYRSQGVPLETIPGWADVTEIRLTRNAIVHNRGLYTWDYVISVPTHRWPDHLVAHLEGAHTDAELTEFLGPPGQYF